MNVKLRETRSFCESCGVHHRAYYERSGKRVLYVVECPEGRRQTTLSSDAEIFEALTPMTDEFCGSPSAQPGGTFALIEVTSGVLKSLFFHFK